MSFSIDLTFDSWVTFVILSSPTLHQPAETIQTLLQSANIFLQSYPFYFIKRKTEWFLLPLWSEPEISGLYNLKCS